MERRRPKIQRLSIEELEDRRAELDEARSEGVKNALRELVQVEEILLRKLTKEKIADEAYKVNLKNKLIDNLIHYGSYLKMEYRKDDFVAKMNLQKALRYDSHLPIAHYRLGFLAYKHKSFPEALSHFQRALQLQKGASNSKYCLNPQQTYNATLYLSNSALHIAKDAQESLEQIEEDVNRHNPVNLELSPIYDLIEKTDEVLSVNAFVVQTKTEKKYCSLETVDKIIDEKRSNHLILYYSDYGEHLYYQRHLVPISLDRAEILKKFLLESCKKNHLTRLDFSDIIPQTNRENFRSYIRRVRDKLSACCLSRDLIVNVQRSAGTETAYYFDQTFPSIVIQRSDM